MVRRNGASRVGETLNKKIENMVQSMFLEFWAEIQEILDFLNENAIELADKIISLAPDTKYGLACQGLRLFNAKEEIPFYTRAIEKDMSFWEGYMMRGDAHYVLDNYRESILDYSAAIKRTPGCSNSKGCGNLRSRAPRPQLSRRTSLGLDQRLYTSCSSVLRGESILPRRT